jgi:hypothetical protein
MILGRILTRTLAILRYTCIVSEVRQYLLLDSKTIAALVFGTLEVQEPTYGPKTNIRLHSTKVYFGIDNTTNLKDQEY